MDDSVRIRDLKYLFTVIDNVIRNDTPHLLIIIDNIKIDIILLLINEK